MANTPFAVKLTPALQERLIASAERERRSPQELATSAIEDFLDARDAFDRAISIACVEADEGRFVSVAAVDRWMESWDSATELPMPDIDIVVPREQQ